MGSLTNNLEHILPFLSFEEGCYYFTQVIQRRKDNNDIKSSNIILRYDFVTSLSDINSKIPFWLKFCEDNNARVYLNPNRKRFDKTAYMMVEILGRNMINNNFNIIPGILSKSVNRSITDKDYKWIIIDIDDMNFDLTMCIMNWLIWNNKEAYMVPTKNGYHVVTKRFDVSSLKEESFMSGIDLDIKKDAPTLLIY